MQELGYTDILILGASVYACGALRALTKRGVRAAVIEKDQSCAAEFADALYTDGDTDAYVPQTEDGADFAGELRRRGILGERGISLPAVSPVICGRFLACGAVLYAASRVTDITSSPDGYRVAFHSMGGQFALRCGAILDTTASFVSAAWFGIERPRTEVLLGANVIGDLSSVAGAVSGNRKGEYFLSVPVRDGDYDGAREELCASIPGESGARIAVTPMTPSVLPAGKGGAYGETLYWAPSASFGTVTAAYDAGVHLGETWTPHGTPLRTCAPAVRQEPDYDVIVCGGGTAGAVAAWVAARLGGRVLLLEDGICLGGMGTAGGVLGYYFGIAGGAYEALDRAAEEIAHTQPVVPMGKRGDLPKRMALGRALRAAGVTVRYEATVTDALCSGNHVRGVRYQADAARVEAYASFVIDATAEGSVCAAAGVPMMAGRASDGSYQPYSNMYAVYREEKDIARYVNSDSGTVDQYDPAALGHAILASGGDPAHLRERFDTGLRYLATAQRIGLREGKRIVGEDTVRLADVLAGRMTPEPVFWGYSNLDNHGKDNALEDSLCRCWNTTASMWGNNLTIPVPAGALIPRGFGGLLVAGRCLSVDHVIASAVRMQYDMQKSGEAAALLAMEAIRRGCGAREVPYDALRPKLLASRCLTEETAPAVIRIGDDRTSERMSGAQMWADDPAWLKEELSGNRPGYAIWSASVHGAKLREHLVSWIHGEDQALRRHAALALGLAGCAGVPFSEAVGPLCEMAADKSGAMVQSGRKYNYPYALSAAVLLELLGVCEAIPLLLLFVSDPAYTAEIPFAACELTEDREDLAFQFFMQGFAALCGFYRRFPDCRAQIAAVMEKRLNAPDFCMRVSGKATSVVKIDYTEKVRRLWQKCRDEAVR